MMVIFVSQCEKNALLKTRRVLDAFANRIGDNTWQTVITDDGLQAVRKLLRKTASKSTAVSCHWIRSRSRSELIWIVGNRNKFNSEGVVPVNYTESDLEQFMDKDKWQSLPIIKSAVELAALFHDFGKANILFQKKLRGEGRNSYEPVRHEWVSLRIFQAFVGDKNDEQWLTALTEIDKSHSDDIFKDGIDKGENHPLANMPTFAQLVGWLILSHHKLPFVPGWKKNLSDYRESSPASIQENNVDFITAWFEKEFGVHWNSYNFYDDDSKELINDNWRFHDNGLPYKSTKWRLKAISAADKALRHTTRFNNENILHNQLFTSHIARMALMLADHYYSALPEPTRKWQSPNYDVYANTKTDTKELKQQLDEHLIGVSKHAVNIIFALTKLKSSLEALEDNSFLKNTKVTNEKFAWQITAYKAAKKLSQTSKKQGFFGINMASTGQGKTLANAKVMYALASEVGDCRFTVALGLRTLTLQTGKEYRKQLDLTNEQLGIAIGGSASKTLFENEQNKKESEIKFGTGSESIEDFLDPELFIDYESTGVEHSLYEWTKVNNRIEKLLQTPALVCTIDHLVPATDGTRGGKQIGPMLRLLTSDLVIDEPDDFGLDDLPALCRLVFWAGMLGSRVLLSTATMPPDLAYATFQAYQSGWKKYAEVNTSNSVNKDVTINCAWFDERVNAGTVTSEVKDFDEFRSQHEKYVAKRVDYLRKKDSIKHKAKILDNLTFLENIYAGFASTILEGALCLHRKNYIEIYDKQVSIGIVRMANINPMVAVSKELIKLVLPENTHIHICIYHSRYPLAIRSYLENQLDSALNRTKNWPPKELEQIIKNTNSKSQLFIVLASPVAEVGRDHDYDWAIIEPSSMRSIIQIAGRVLRHRNLIPEQENILLINQNIKQLNGRERCFNRPGFEVEKLKLKMIKHQMKEVLDEQQFTQIDSVERVVRPKGLEPEQNLVALEHQALFEQLFKNYSSAKLWWKTQTHWCGVLPYLQPFRESAKDNALFLTINNGDTKWLWKNESVSPPKMGTIDSVGISITTDSNISLADGFGFWFDLDANNIYTSLAKDLSISIEEASMRFGEVRLISYSKNDTNEYKYFNNFGVYQEVK